MHSRLWIAALGLPLLGLVPACRDGRVETDRGAGDPAPQTVLAERPPMGWNSWNSFGVTVTEAQVRANADYMAEHLRSHGWEYVVVDLGWYLPPGIDTSSFKMKKPPQAIDAHGRLVPDPVKFPSAADGRGLRPLADYVHGRGLKLGIHVMRGIPWQAAAQEVTIAGTGHAASAVVDEGDVCEWYHGMYGVDTTKPGGQEYYDSLAALYGEWGVDYVKADDMSRPYHEAEIEALAAALGKAGRPIVLSLSPGSTPIERAPHVKEHAQLWRISPDFWDHWPLLERQFDLCRLWQPHVGPGHWPDADMLPLGKLRVTGPDDYVAEQMGRTAEEITDEYTRLSPAEQRTLMTLWSIFRSPLMMGGHLPDNDEATLALLTNDEVLAVNQRGTRGRELRSEGDRVVWAAEDPTSDAVYVALFNKGAEKTRLVRVELETLGLQGRVAARDLWRRSDVGEFEGSLAAEVEPHGAVFLKLSPSS